MDVRPEALAQKVEGYRGAREAFLQSAFGAPERVSKIELLATRAFEDLRGITSAMGQQINRILADGMSHGLGPGTMAKTMADTISGISRTRAEVLARTETIHAHAEGQLDSFEDLKIPTLGVMVEWSTAGDEKVCEACEDMEGRTFKIEESRGLIPRHPNCRCAWIPAVGG
jgi:SPP1 gp7 family putative phage head morphogenesis protein